MAISSTMSPNKGPRRQLFTQYANTWYIAPIFVGLAVVLTGFALHDRACLLITALPSWATLKPIFYALIAFLCMSLAYWRGYSLLLSLWMGILGTAHLFGLPVTNAAVAGLGATAVARNIYNMPYLSKLIRIAAELIGIALFSAYFDFQYFGVPLVLLHLAIRENTVIRIHTIGIAISLFISQIHCSVPELCTDVLSLNYSLCGVDGTLYACDLRIIMSLILSLIMWTSAIVYLSFYHQEIQPTPELRQTTPSPLASPARYSPVFKKGRMTLRTAHAELESSTERRLSIPVRSGSVNNPTPNTTRRLSVTADAIEGMRDDSKSPLGNRGRVGTGERMWKRTMTPPGPPDGRKESPFTRGLLPSEGRASTGLIKAMRSIDRRDSTPRRIRLVEPVEEPEFSETSSDSFEECDILHVIIIADPSSAVLCEIIETSDHECVVARNTKDAVVEFGKGGDLIILHGDEKEVLTAVEAVRAIERTKGVEKEAESAVIVVFEGDGGREEVFLGMSLSPHTHPHTDVGANDYIDRDNLISVLPRVLQQLSTMKAFKEFNHECNDLRAQAEARSEALFGVLERFLPPYFHELVDTPGLTLEDLQLGAAMEKVATVLFSDIRKFTTLTENLSSTDAMQFLNTYFAFAFPAIMDYGGFVEKTIGDSIMAIFLGENQANNSVRAAIACQRALDFMNETGFKTGVIETGIGISVGRMMMGIVGTESRMELTCIGDRVNLGARIEALCKVYGSRILIAGHVFDALGEHAGEYKIRKVDNLTVRGRVRPTVVCEVYDADRPDIIKAKDSIAQDYDKGVDLFEQGDFVSALQCFLRCKAKFKEDIPTSHFIGRCRQLIAHPPTSWNGVCHFVDKVMLVYDGMSNLEEEDVTMRQPSKDVPIVRLEAMPCEPLLSGKIRSPTSSARSSWISSESLK